MTKGRKRKLNVKRTASGRISRASGSYQENTGPIETRMRMFGLSESDARDQKASTFVGRLVLSRTISTTQYEAAVAFAELRDSFKRALGAPDSLKSSGGPSGGEETASHTHWCQQAIAKYEAALKAIGEEQQIVINRGANLFAAVDYILFRDQAHQHMVGDLRIALNALVHHFGMTAGGKRRTLDNRGQIAA